MFKSTTGQANGGQTALASLEQKLTGGAPGDPAIPATLRKAVRFMLAGAATTGLFGLFLIVVTIANKNALTDSSGKKLSSGQFTGGLVGTILIYVIFVALWVLMARMNLAGQSWARIAATVLFAFSSWNLFSIISSLRGGDTVTVLAIVYIVATIAIWLAGLGAIAMLWRADTSTYFREHQAQRTR